MPYSHFRMGVYHTLVLNCNGSGNTGAVPLCHLLATHVITCVWLAAVHPRTGTLASRQALITPGTYGVDCTVPRGPVSGEWGVIRPRPALHVHLLRISPIRPTPSCYLRGLVFLVLRPNQSSHLSSGKPPTASRIFLVLHSYPTLVSINSLIDLRVHCIVHLAQDRFLCRSSGRLVIGKAAKDVAPVPSSEIKCYARAEQCGIAQYLGKERDGFPKEKIT